MRERREKIKRLTTSNITFILLLSCGDVDRPKIEEPDVDRKRFDVEQTADSANGTLPESFVRGGVVENSESGTLTVRLDDERFNNQEFEVVVKTEQGEEATTPQKFSKEDVPLDFKLQVEERFSDGVERSMTVFVVLNEETYTLQGTPFSFFSVDPSVTGSEFFNLHVSDKLEFYCSRCHSISYQQQLQFLAQPSVDEGGTPESNQLVLHPRGRLGHPGGRICVKADSSPCVEIKRWWRLEFGNRD